MNHFHIAHFRIEGEISRGEVGIVYRAFDESLKRQVAVKILHPQMVQNEAIIPTFIEEVQKASVINDPHVVHTYFIGQHDGNPYVVMELVRGQSIGELIEKQPRLAESMVLSIAIETAQGLQAALTAGLVHGDLSPYEILLDEKHGVKLLNFGFSQLKIQFYQQQGRISANPMYLPPERVSGGPEDHRADMFSLGATLYELLAGRPPFRGRNAEDVALKRLKEPPTELLSLVPGIKPQTASIISRLLARNPEDRYTDYDELLSELHLAQSQIVNPVAPEKTKAHSQKGDVGRTITSKKGRASKDEMRNVPGPRQSLEEMASESNAPIRKRNKSLGARLVWVTAMVFCAVIIGILWKMNSQTDESSNEFYIVFEPLNKGASKPLSRKFEGRLCLVDSGQTFGKQENGFTYGWNASPADIKPIDMSTSPLYVGNVEFPSDSSVKWEMEMPNGVYTVRAACGDPRWYSSKIYLLYAEGIRILSGIPTEKNTYLEGAIVVKVNDGKMTISTSDKSSETRLVFLHIRATPDATPTGNLPTAKILNVTDQQVLQAPGKASFLVEPSDPSNVQRMKVYHNSIKVDEKKSPPWEFEVKGMEVGTHWICVEVEENNKNFFLTDRVRIQVHSLHDAIPFDIGVNFQPLRDKRQSAEPSRFDSIQNLQGYLRDYGNIFGERRNGAVYGWNVELVSGATGFHPSPFMEDPRYTTFANLCHDPAKAECTKWEMMVPNGWYEVRLAAGRVIPKDSSFFEQETHLRIHILIENILFCDELMTGGPNFFVDRAVKVEVKDGRLTIEPGSTSWGNRLCFVELRRLPGANGRIP